MSKRNHSFSKGKILQLAIGLLAASAVVNHSLVPYVVDRPLEVQYCIPGNLIHIGEQAAGDYLHNALECGYQPVNSLFLEPLVNVGTSLPMLFFQHFSYSKMRDYTINLLPQNATAALAGSFIFPVMMSGVARHIFESLKTVVGGGIIGEIGISALGYTFYDPDKVKGTITKFLKKSSFIKEHFFKSNDLYTLKVWAGLLGTGAIVLGGLLVWLEGKELENLLEAKAKVLHLSPPVVEAVVKTDLNHKSSYSQEENIEELDYHQMELLNSSENFHEV